MNVVSDLHNKLLKRREVSVSFDNAGNPGFGGAAQMLAEHFKVDSELIAVKRILNTYGSHKTIVDALIYDSVEAKEKIEPKPKAKKEGSS